MRTPFVIAEFASCHEGEFERALRGIEVAKQADADAYKLQYWSSPARMRARRSIDAPEAYERESALKHWLPELSARAHSAGLEFMCTAFLPEDIEVVAPFVDRFKISAFEASDEAFVKAHRGYNKPLVISLSMGQKTSPYVFNVPVDRLHCVSAYPTPTHEANLAAITEDNYSGFSDHTRCIYTGGFAVSAGADMLEVHFRLGDTSPGCADFPVALSPDGLEQYVMLARLAHVMRGDGVKRVQPSEQAMLKHRVRT